MPTATKIKHARHRELREWSASAPSGSPLRVDRDKRVIYGVRVLGRFSKNSHGLREATGGTEYTQRCMEESLPLYEGAEVLSGHETPGTRRANGGNDDVMGVLRNARLDGSGDKLCIRADLHYFDSHSLTRRVLEDVESGLGVYGLSHDARAKRERFDTASRRLVIESLATVKSVDLVRKPATNRNLWEEVEHRMGTTLREQLEARRPKWSKPRRKWADRLLEDDTMAPAMDAPVDVDDGGGDEEDALWSGFQAAISKVMDSYKAGEIDAKEAGKKIADWIKAHDKLTGTDEPEAPDTSAASGTGDSDADKTESVKDDAARLKHQLAVRDLFEDLGVRPDKVLRESAENQPTLEAARKLIEREKARGSGSPRSSGFGGSGGGKPAGKAPGSPKEFAASIKE